MKPELLILQQLLNQQAWTPEEEQWLISYLEKNNASELYLLLKKSFEEDLASGRKISPVISGDMLSRILSKTGLSLPVASGEDDIPISSAQEKEQLHASVSIPIQTNKRHTNFFPLPGWRAAAAVLLISVAGLSVYFISGKKSQKENSGVAFVSPVHPLPVTVVPGSNKAILKLANGQTIQLDSSQNGYLISQANTKISNADGKLSYKSSNTSNTTTADLAPATMVYNVLTTPKGGQYQVVLQDGTKVWLNAASSLRYPTVFLDKDRTVELTGEGYFEVAKNKDKPFHVMTRDHTAVEVLGTHFNIMAYEEEGSLNTTLAEGSVKVTRDGHQATLVPGQQALLAANSNDFKVMDADLEQVLAWKDGLFQFDKLNIQTIMRQVGRWYDVDISYEVTDLQKQVYSGAVSRKENIAELLKQLEYTGTVHFKLEGRKIIVTK